jgi:endonuclease III
MPPVSSPSRPAAVARRIIERLQEAYPGAHTELHYQDPFQLLVATMLSAQSTDRRVNEVTPALFRRYPDAGALARANQAELEAVIRATGFFRAKSRALVGMAGALLERHGGAVPARLEDLVELPGVGRKTANVVLGHALGVPGLPVDRHVLRVANRLGIASGQDPDVVEAQLCRALPARLWTPASDVLILHGRRVCRPRPLCDQCVVRADCEYYADLSAGRSAAAARPAASHPRARSSKPGGKGSPSVGSAPRTPPHVHGPDAAARLLQTPPARRSRKR